MNEQSGSTLVTTINGSRSCHITTNRFAFPTVETILARTKHLQYHLQLILQSLQSVNALTKRQKKEFF